MSFDEEEHEETDEQFILRTSVQCFAELYYRLPKNGSGGTLHVVLDDGNLEDVHVRDCMMDAIGEDDYLGYLIAHLLLQMPQWQRERLYSDLQR